MYKTCLGMLSWLMPCRPSLLSLPTDNDLVSVTGWQIRLHLNSFPAPRCYVLSSALVPPPTVWQVSGCDDDSIKEHALFFDTLVQNSNALAYGDTAAFLRSERSWPCCPSYSQAVSPDDKIFVRHLRAWHIVSKNNRTRPDWNQLPQPQWSPDSPFGVEKKL